VLSCVRRTSKRFHRPVCVTALCWLHNYASQVVWRVLLSGSIVRLSGVPRRQIICYRRRCCAVTMTSALYSPVGLLARNTDWRTRRSDSLHWGELGAGQKGRRRRSFLTSRWQTAFWDTEPRCLVEVYRRFRGAYCPVDRCSMNFWNDGLVLRDYAALCSRRLSSSYSPPWEPEISQGVFQLPLKLWQREKLILSI
jgi:hypothetical protein